MTPDTPAAGALAGLRVLDLTRVVAGPWATQTLADLGADVIKIERPGSGDPTRLTGPFLLDAQGRPTPDSAFYLSCNRGKRSVALDIAEPGGADTVRALARQCDIVVENYKTGDLARYGLDYAALRELRPDLIYCSITGFGQDGPYAHRPAYDSVLQAMCGLMSTCGAPDGQPMRTGIPITDICTGLYACIAILAAVVHRRSTGEGQYIDCALLDAATAMNGHLALGYLLTGTPPSRQGNDNPIASPSEVVRTRDGYFMLSVGADGQFRSLARVLGLDALADDPRFATNAQRILHRRELCARIEEVTVTRDAAHWLDVFSAAKVPGAPINDMRQVFDDPQVRHRGLALELPHAGGTPVPSLRSPLRLSRNPVQHRAPPRLGEHTETVLRELLGAAAPTDEAPEPASITPRRHP